VSAGTDGHIFATTRHEPFREPERTIRWSPSLRRNGPDPHPGRSDVPGTVQAAVLERVGQSRRMATTDVARKLDRLHHVLAATGGVVVAYSGGTDSTLVAAVAARALGERALAITAVSPSLPPGEADEARRVAGELGIAHRTVRTHEAERPAYLANGVDRCYHCKTELYDVLTRVAEESDFAVVVSGANLDDLGDFRPGLTAAAEHGVRHPLVEVAMSKSDVREAARELDIPTWDKPASACLASRIPFGVTIKVEELSKVGRAEQLLKELGFRQCRVRVHGDVARIEVERADIARLAEPGVRERAVHGLQELGYRYVALDLEGFRSGSMNPRQP
jgi:pyridinium-3,5-biscarboxylic acid mononucleotide sulfurtransferase